MDYLGHTQSANYTFGPWKSNAFRLEPFSLSHSVDRQQTSGSPSSSSALPALTRSATTFDGSWKQPSLNRQAPPTDTAWLTSTSPSNSLFRSKTSIPKVGFRDGFDSSYRPAVCTSRTSTDGGDFVGSQQQYPEAPTASSTARHQGSADWASSTRLGLSSADRARASSELVRADVLSLCRDTCDRMKKTQADTTRRIGDRITEVQFWRDEVRKESELATNEAAALQKAICNLERALDESRAPVQIAEDCLMLRREKICDELVHDNVEKELLKELECASQGQQEMKDLLNDVKSLALSNQKSRMELVNDAANKQEAHRLDKAAHQLRQTSQGLQRIDGITEIDNTISDTESWMRHTNELIAKSQADRASSVEARNLIEQMMDKCATSAVNQWNVVNAALNDNIVDYTNARNKLQTQLAKVLQETVQQEKSRELLVKCVRDKEATLKLAQTRYATRMPRPNMEACKDQAHIKLVHEIQSIGETVDNLRSKMADIENSLSSLNQTRFSLEQDLNVKNNFIHIDRDMCLSWRKSFDMAPRRTIKY